MNPPLVRIRRGPYDDGSPSSLDALFERFQRVLEEKHRPPTRAL
ncbi:MAG: hypothetical protein VX466_09545 [Myxococcota bacterium]|nr:hypothetical protein [Myxococcota bacterium]